MSMSGVTRVGLRCTMYHKDSSTQSFPMSINRCLMSPGYCSSTDVNAQTSDGTYRTPLQITMEKGYDEIMKLLSEHGAKLYEIPTVPVNYVYLDEHGTLLVL